MSHTLKLGNKKEISEIFASLRKLGYLVFNFNNNQSFRVAQAGFVDYFIIGKGKIIMIEVKLGKDKFSEAQEKLKQEALKAPVIYAVVTSIEDALVVRDLCIE